MFSSFTLVFLGNFNPAIFHPDWIDRFKILPVQDTQWSLGKKPKKREVEMPGKQKIVIESVPYLYVTPDFTRLTFPHLQLEVTSGKYLCRIGVREKFSEVLTFTKKSFRLLEHTPVKAVGINFDSHVVLESSKPKEKLKELFSKSEDVFESVLGADYLIDGRLVFWNEGVKTTIKFEESTEIADGIFINGNYHKNIEPPDVRAACDWAEQYFQPAFNKHREIIKQLLGSVKETWTPEQP